ncbi:MAG: hypothetical protein P1U46_03965 [Patescibacteria group bacterium]|nr:hypothetical protein [Patescibacteria group bacterium]
MIVKTNKNISKKLFVTKSEVVKRALVEKGNSIEPSSNIGLIAGITYIKTIDNAKRKKQKIIIG